MSEYTNDITSCHNPLTAKYLAGINDQIPQPAPCRQKFPDYNSHQAQPDVDLHIADDGRDGAWQDYFGEGMPFIAAQGVDQLDLFRVYADEAGIQA